MGRPGIEPAWRVFIPLPLRQSAIIFSLARRRKLEYVACEGPGNCAASFANSSARSLPGTPT